MPLQLSQAGDYNREVKTWTKNTETKLVQKLLSLDLASKIEVLQRARENEGRKALRKSVKSRTPKSFGFIETVTFSFPVHGWYYDRGVGKGTPLSKVGSSKRIPKPWIEVVLEKEIELLADMLQQTVGDDAIESIKLSL